MSFMEIDKYQIIKELGGGEYGRVYHVFDRALQSEKAIKVLNVSDPSKFISSLEEAQIQNACRHNHIVNINEANIFYVNGQQRVILDLEYISSGSLEDAIKGRWVSACETVSRIRGALRGLHYAHTKGFLHRDVKPGNILVYGQSAKLSDFGLATEPGASLLGSPRGYRTHLAPECFGSSPTSVLSDLYAAGITLFRTSSNIADWRSVVKSMPNVQSVIQRGGLINRIGFERFIPKKLQKIIRKACASNPNKRYQTAQQLCQALDRLRYRIDWSRVSDYWWSGIANGAKYECRVIPKNNSVVIKKNGRRIGLECCQCADLAEAISTMDLYVANTSFE